MYFVVVAVVLFNRPWSNKLEAFLRYAIFEHAEDFEKNHK
jgi:hypothetical protein